jgi:hypothetical protein
MAGLVPAIHVCREGTQDVDAGTRPGMTACGIRRYSFIACLGPTPEGRSAFDNNLSLRRPGRIMLKISRETS